MGAGWGAALSSPDPDKQPSCLLGAAQLGGSQAAWCKPRPGGGSGDSAPELGASHPCCLSYLPCQEKGPKICLSAETCRHHLHLPGLRVTWDLSSGVPSVLLWALGSGLLLVMATGAACPATTVTATLADPAGPGQHFPSLGLISLHLLILFQGQLFMLQLTEAQRKLWSLRTASLCPARGRASPRKATPLWDLLTT